MEIISQLENKRITIDHSLLLLALNKDPERGETMLKILQQIEQGKLEQAYLSALSYAEIIRGYANEEVAKKVQTLLFHFPNLTIVPLDSTIAEQSAAVQRKYELSFQDAVLVATAMKTKSDMIITGGQAAVSISGVNFKSLGR